MHTTYLHVIDISMHAYNYMLLHMYVHPCICVYNQYNLFICSNYVRISVATGSGHPSYPAHLVRVIVGLTWTYLYA